MAAKREVRLTYLGHASVLIEIGGIRVLTDPLLRPRLAHLTRIAPPVPPERLEDIDLVLISHAHHDHLDVRSLKQLPGSPPVICPPPAQGAVRRAGLRAEVPAAGDVVVKGRLQVEATPADHDGRRWPTSSGRESLGFVLRDATGSVYFAGDTGLFDGLAEIRDVGVALLPVAGWGPKVGPGHLNPLDAARAAALVRPQVAVPIHWGTYRRMLMPTTETPDAPAQRFVAHLAELAPGVRGELVVPGGTLTLALGSPRPHGTCQPLGWPREQG